MSNSIDIVINYAIALLLYYTTSYYLTHQVVPLTTGRVSQASELL